MGCEAPKNHRFGPGSCPKTNELVKNTNEIKVNNNTVLVRMK